jgi:hypothetical protein
LVNLVNFDFKLERTYSISLKDVGKKITHIQFKRQIKLAILQQDHPINLTTRTKRACTRFDFTD